MAVAVALPKLRESRAGRPPPLRDDKILAAWNGLVLSALARTGFALDEPRYRERARQLAEYLLDRMRDGDGRLVRSALGHRTSGDAFLDDYAFVIQGLIDLYEADGEPRWLAAAIELQRAQDEHYLDAKHGGYFTTAHDGEPLLARHKPDYDGAEPSGNSVAAANLLRLHQFTGEDALRERAMAVLSASAKRVSRAPLSAPKMLVALDYALDRPRQIYIVAAAGEEPNAELLAVLRRNFVPNHAIVVASETEVAAHVAVVPGIDGKVAMGGKTTAYVCEANVCQRPTSDPREFAAQVRAVNPYPK